MVVFESTQQSPAIRLLNLLNTLCFRFIRRSPCSMRGMVSGGTLAGDLWLLPTGSWLLLTASSRSSRTTHKHYTNLPAQNLLITTIVHYWNKKKTSCLCTAPSSPIGCLWENTTWLRRKLAPRLSCLRRLSSMKNGTLSSWPSGNTVTTVQCDEEWAESPAYSTS